MPNDQNDPLRPTFPIPDSAIKGRKASIVAKSPVTMVAGGVAVGGAVVSAVASLPILSVGVVGAAATGLAVFWKKRLGGMDQKIVRDLVDESNEAQNAELLKRMKELEKAGYSDYAKTLGNFVSVKVEIEKELRQYGNIEEGYRRTEKLIDTLVADVADQFRTLVKLDKHQDRLKRSSSDKADTRREEIRQTQKTLANQIERAYIALREIGRNVDDIVDPISPEQDLVSGRLEETISDLHEESEIAQHVGSRMEEGF